MGRSRFRMLWGFAKKLSQAERLLCGKCGRRPGDLLRPPAFYIYPVFCYPAFHAAFLKMQLYKAAPGDADALQPFRKGGLLGGNPLAAGVVDNGFRLAVGFKIEEESGLLRRIDQNDFPKGSVYGDDFFAGVYADDGGAVVTGLDNGIEEVRLIGDELRAMQNLFVLHREMNPEGQHPPVRGGELREHLRNLQDAEEGVEDLQRGVLDRFVAAPGQHVAVTGSTSAQQPEVDRSDPVGDEVAGAVSHPEDVPVLPHGGDDMLLPEFNQNIRFDFLQCGGNILQQPLGGVLNAGIVHAGRFFAPPFQKSGRGNPA